MLAPVASCSVESSNIRANGSRGLTSRYKFDVLVYIEPHSDPNEAVARERQIKGWRREKKLRLIMSANPDWADLSAEWEEDESWKSIPEAKARPVLRRRSGKS